MKIGELARLGQCTVETVRYYEKAGLLPPAARTGSNYRHYGDAHVARLRFIRNCRALDMTHDEVRALLGLVDQPANDCGGVNRVLDEHIAHVEVRIKELKQLKQQLVALRQSCQGEQAVIACGIVQGLTTMETETKNQRQTHLG
jgi:Cd(II)/Pb(II)-responsive transcriptional regulator